MAKQKLCSVMAIETEIIQFENKNDLNSFLEGVEMIPDDNSAFEYFRYQGKKWLLDRGERSIEQIKKKKNIKLRF